MQNVKKSHIFITLLIILILIGLGSFLREKQPNIPDWKISQPTNESYDVGVNVTKKTDDKQSYTIESEVPRFVIKNHAALSAQINNQIEDYVNSAIASFKEETFDNDALPAGQGVDNDVQNPSSNEKSTFTISYSPHENVNNKFLTVEFGASSYASGAAHPLSFTHVINFNLADGKIVKLGDLFSVDEKTYLDKISNYSKADLRKTLIKALSLNDDNTGDSSSIDQAKDDILEGVFFEEGALPLAQNYSEFKIKKDGLEFIFGQYQVAPYVVGELRVLVPYTELQGMLRV